MSLALLTSAPSDENEGEGECEDAVMMTNGLASDLSTATLDRHTMTANVVASMAEVARCSLQASLLMLLYRRCY